MIQELRIELFGGLQISKGGVPVAGYISAKAPALLCYLAVTGRPHSRPALAGLLWGDWPEAEALGHLRKAIHNLRRLVDPWLSITPQSVALNDAAPLWLDVKAFEQHAGCREQDGAPAAQRLQIAADLYRGDFLAGFYVREAPDFEEWVTAQRERLRQLAFRVLDTLAAYHAARDELAASIGCVTRLLALEPWREETHRQMIWLLARSGQRTAALAQYEACRRALRTELDVEPDEETTALHHRILAAASPRPNNLPAQTTSFIGRRTALAHIVRLLADSGCRLVTLVGPGGVGKTRLALEAASTLTTDKTGAFAGGVYLVSLAAPRSSERIVSAIGGAVGFTFRAGGDPMAQLVAALGDRELLLLLDTFEPVIDSATLVADLLAGCSKLKVLVTSRQALNLRGEQQIPVAPLSLPDQGWKLPASEGTTAAPLPEAVALFLDRARAVQPGFGLAGHGAAVAEICARLDGLPLAIELAAARSLVLVPEAMLARLSSRLELLTGGARDLPARQQTLRTAIAWSYDLLTPAEQSLFARLAVFADSATQEAIEAVCSDGGDPAPAPGPVVQAHPLAEAIDSLQAKSLLQRFEPAQGEPRFRMLDTVREYAWERLAEWAETDALRARHAAFYLALAEASELGLKGSEQQAWLDRLEAEHNNLRGALQWAIDGHRAETAQRLGSALYPFWIMRSYFDEAGRWLEAALDLPAPQPTALTSQANLTRAKALNAAGAITLDQGQYDRAIAHLEESLALRRRLEDHTGVMVTLAWLGGAALQLDDLDRAEAYCRESLVMAQGKGPAGNSVAAFVLSRLGDIADLRGDYDTARSLYESGLALWREMDSKNGIVCGLGSLGALAASRGHYGQAIPLLRDMLSLAWETQDRLHVVHALAWLARVAAGLKQTERAVRLLGQVDVLAMTTGFGFAPDDRTECGGVLASARAQLGDAAFEAAWAAGQALPLEQVVQVALST
jgi:predicted ATPase/DNA-binding SARP family transcriptional activator